MIIIIILSKTTSLFKDDFVDAHVFVINSSCWRALGKEVLAHYTMLVRRTGVGYSMVQSVSSLPPLWNVVVFLLSLLSQLLLLLLLYSIPISYKLAHLNVCIHVVT